VSEIFIAYRCPGGPGGRNRLSPRFSTIYEIFSDDIFFISDVSTVPRWKKYLASTHLSPRFSTTSLNISPVEEIIECHRFS